MTWRFLSGTSARFPTEIRRRPSCHQANAQRFPVTIGEPSYLDKFKQHTFRNNKINYIYLSWVLLSGGTLRRIWESCAVTE